LPSSQLTGVPGAQTPLWQLSAPLQTLPSAHDVPFKTALFVHPKTGSQASVVHTLLSLQLMAVPGVHVPLWQVSVPLHTLLSRHDVPLRTAVFTQPVTALQVSVVQTLLSLQLRAVPAVQLPAWQLSAPLQTVPSRQGVPLATGVFEQPKTGLQESVVQTLLSLQLSAVPAVHTPAWQLSAPLQTLPSRHAVPLSTAVLPQPVTGLQASVVQTLPSLQLSAVPGVHAPLWHVSAPLQTLPSEHAVPFASATFWQPLAALQASVVQALPSLQLSAVPGVQVPAWQVSPPLHTVVSAHDEPFGTAACWQPAMGSQVSFVHTLLSLQVSAVPAVHTPLWQVSLPLHRLPSAHGAPLTSVGLLHTPAVHTSLVHGLPSAQSAFTTHESQPAIGVFWQPLSAWHESVVQALPSLQLRLVPAVQTPAWQVSAPLQTLPSAHDVPFRTGVFEQPKTGSQASVVQTLASLQLRVVPAVQVPL
jgi:hypothetical protein